MSTRDSILTIAKTLTGSVASTVTLGTFYDECARTLARLPSPPFIATSGLAITSGTTRYAYPANAIRILGVFHSGRQIPHASLPELESYERTWRGTSSTTTLAVYPGDETARSIRTYPSPSTSSTGAWLYSNVPDPVPHWLDAFMIYAILQREYAYPSDHQDKTTSDVYGKLATLTAQLLGLTAGEK